MTTPIQAALDDLKRQHEELNKRAAKLRQNKRLINRILAKLEPARQAGVLAHSPSLWADDYGANVSATVCDAEGFKHPVVVALLEKFNDTDECRTQDYPSYLNRDFIFKYRSEGYAVTVRIGVYVREDSPTCKKVSKGKTTKVVEEEQFEIVCA